MRIYKKQISKIKIISDLNMYRYFKEMLEYQESLEQGKLKEK